jgi:hypothetical protein
MNEPVQAQEPSGNTPIPLINSFWRRLLYGAFIVIAPIFNFMFVGIMKPLWQTGKFSDHVYMLLISDASIWFFPLLVYSIISYLLILINEERFSRLFIVRLGVYTGVVLSFQYSLLTVLTWELSLIVLVYVATIMSPILFLKLKSGFANRWNLHFFLLLIVVSVFALYLLTALIGGGFRFSFFILLLLPAMAAPFWAFLIALQAVIWLLKYHETKLTLVRGLGILAWLSSYILALRFDVLKMYELYTALPSQPPDCYIATAATKGHPRIVRSRLVPLDNEWQIRINPQLQWLKFA